MSYRLHLKAIGAGIGAGMLVASALMLVLALVGVPYTLGPTFAVFAVAAIVSSAASNWVYIRQG